MNIFTTWKDKITGMLDVQIKLIKLSIIERASLLMATVMVSFIYLAICLAILAFMGWGLMEYFNELVDSRVQGAFITSGAFVVLFLLLYLLRKVLVKAFAGIFIGILTQNGEDEDED